jgi:hypothetical protein
MTNTIDILNQSLTKLNFKHTQFLPITQITLNVPKLNFPDSEEASYILEEYYDKLYAIPGIVTDTETPYESYHETFDVDLNFFTPDSEQLLVQLVTNTQHQINELNDAEK